MGLQARLMAQALRKLTGRVESAPSLIFINQLREKIGVMFGSPETTPGDGPQVLLLAPPRHPPDRGHQGRRRGRATARPRQGRQEQGRGAVQAGRFDIMYGEGISREGSLLDVALDLGFVNKSGAWFTYEGEQLGQGRET